MPLAEEKAPSAVRLADVSDLFEAPSSSLLLHACNCRGSWGSGIAASFRQRFPESYEIYRSYCLPEGDNSAKKRGNPKVLGSALICPPEGLKKHRVVCLMTSLSFGKNRDHDKVILESTEKAFKDLVRQLGDKAPSERLSCCKFNSGKFGMPWEKTVAIIEKVALSAPEGLQVWVHAGEPAATEKDDKKRKAAKTRNSSRERSKRRRSSRKSLEKGQQKLAF